MSRPARLSALLLSILVLGIYWLTARQPALGEDLNVYMMGGELGARLFAHGTARGFGRILGNFFSLVLTWDPFSVFQPSPAVFLGFFAWLGWKAWPTLPLPLRSIVPVLLLAGMPYYGHAIIMKSSAPIHGLSCVFMVLVWKSARNPERKSWAVLGLIASCLLSEVLFFAIASGILLDAGLRALAVMRKKPFSPLLPLDRVFPWSLLLLGGILAYRFAFLGQAIQHHPRTFTIPDALKLAAPAILKNTKELAVLAKDLLPALAFLLGLSSLFPRSGEVDRRPYGIAALTLVTSFFFLGLFLYWLENGVLDWRARFTVAALLTLCAGAAFPSGLTFFRARKTWAIASSIFGAIGLFWFFGKTFLWNSIDLAAWDHYRAMARARDPELSMLRFDFGTQDDRYRIVYPAGSPPYASIEQYVNRDLSIAPFWPNRRKPLP